MLNIVVISIVLSLIGAACSLPDDAGDTPAAGDLDIPTPGDDVPVGGEQAPTQPAAAAEESPLPTEESAPTEQEAEPTPSIEEIETALIPSSALDGSCINFPAEEISKDNSAGRLRTSLTTGDPAVDFTLQDVNGVSHTLSDLLKTKPVLLVLGGFT